MTPRRIFILRPDNLGDLVLFSGALRHMRKLWPEAHITLCVKRYGTELFSHCPHVDRILPYQDIQWINYDVGRLPWLLNIHGQDRIGTMLRHIAPNIVRFPYRCDIALLPLLAPFAEYHELMRRLPAKTRIGICGNSTNQSAEDDRVSRSLYDRQMDASAFPWNLSELEATRRFLEFLGIKLNGDDLWPEFWTTPNDRLKAESLIPAEASYITLGVAPGVSSSPLKYLPPEWFSKAVQNIGDQKLRVILLGSLGDKPLCDEVAKNLVQLTNVSSVHNLAGLTTVNELVECTRRCDVLLCQDAATLHIATAQRKLVAGILGGGHFGRFYPWGDPALTRVVNKPMDCYGCNWKCIYDTVRCMREIPPDLASQALRELIATSRTVRRDHSVADSTR